MYTQLGYLGNGDDARKELARQVGTVIAYNRPMWKWYQTRWGFSWNAKMRFLNESKVGFPLHQMWKIEQERKDLPSIQEQAEAIAAAVKVAQAKAAAVAEAAKIPEAVTRIPPPMPPVTPGAPPRANVFPLMARYRAQAPGMPAPAFDADEAPPAPEKKKPGIGTILLLAAPVILATMAG